MTIAQQFEALGKPENIGCAFAITVQALEDGLVPLKNGKLDLAKLPRPDYEHRIMRDARTDYYLVIRPDVDGVYTVLDGTERVR